jgi:hypothetical protein
MIGNLFVKVLSVAAPTVATIVALNASGEQMTAVMPALPSNVVQARAEAPVATVAELDGRQSTSVPVVVTTSTENGEEDLTLQFPLEANLVSSVKESFQGEAGPILRSIEQALLEGTQAKDPQVRADSNALLPSVQRAVPYQVVKGIEIPARIEKAVAHIAQKTYQKTGKRIVVTSAARSPQSQAAAMKHKLDLGESPRRLYANKRAAAEIENAYLWGRKTGMDGEQIVDTMASVIDRQIDAGTYISRHLKEGAVDLRSRDLSSAEKVAVRQAAKSLGARVMLESTPPHFHLEIL